MKATPMPSLERLEELFYLDDTSPSGLRRRVSRRGGGPVGSVAGSLNGQGYWNVVVDGKQLRAHRVVWVLANREPIPDGMHIDHRDGCPDNNRPENLRLATRQQNAQNGGTRRNNTSGVVGVYWAARAGKWQAYICVGGRRLHLGLFTALEEAAAARREAEIRYFGEFRRAA